jgi:hypothetical protein
LLAVLLSTTSCNLSPAPPTPTPEPITLRFAFRQNVADYRPLVSQFQQLHPGIVVKLVPIESFEHDPLAEIDSQELDVVRWGQDFLTADRRIERNDPDGLRPRRGAEVRGGFEAAGS